MRPCALLLAALLTGCASHATVTPKPDIHPVVVSNQQTRASIKTARKDIGDTRKSIKDAQESQARGDDKLQSVDQDLKELLGEH